MFKMAEPIRPTVASLMIITCFHYSPPKITLTQVLIALNAALNIYYKLHCINYYKLQLYCIINQN